MFKTLKTKDKILLTVTYKNPDRTNTYEAEVIGVYGSTVRLMYRTGNRRMTSIALDSTSMERTTNKMTFKVLPYTQLQVVPRTTPIPQRRLLLLQA